MNDQRVTDLIDKKIKLDGIREMIEFELESFKAKCAENPDPDAVSRAYEIYENNIRLLTQFAQIL